MMAMKLTTTTTAALSIYVCVDDIILYQANFQEYCTALYYKHHIKDWQTKRKYSAVLIGKNV